MIEKLANLLRVDEPPDFKAKPVPVDWYPVAQLSLPSGELWVGDPGFSWAELRSDDGCRISLPAGDYEVTVFVIAQGKMHAVSKLRVCQTGIADPEVGEQVAEAGTDSATLGVADARELAAAFQARFDDDEDEPVTFLEDFDFDYCGLVQPAGDNGAALIYVATGSDGGVPVHELVSGGRRVGIEVPF